ncbi:MAG: Transcriptional regulator, MarR family, partial [uncultured Rubrobacteraceae bacterium]
GQMDHRRRCFWRDNPGGLPAQRAPDRRGGQHSGPRGPDQRALAGSGGGCRRTRFGRPGRP